MTPHGGPSSDSAPRTFARYVLVQTRGMALGALAFLVPFLLLLHYTAMNVEVALLHRKIKSLKGRKSSLVKKNTAIRDAINDLTKGRGGSVGALETGKNKIVRLKLIKQR